MTPITVVSAGPAPNLRFGTRVRLVVEILSAYRSVRAIMAQEKLLGGVERIRSTPRSRRRRALPNAALDGVRLGSAVTRTLRLSRCLTRSLVLLALLAARGERGELVISVLPGEKSQLGAHAWVELDGRPLLVPAPTHGRLLTL